MKRCKKSIVLTLALALLVTVLTVSGSTIAWFTEKTESANNIISAGTLDIEMQYRSIDEAGNATWNHVENYQPVFKDDGSHLPGHLEVVLVRAQNAGTLDFKYQLVITAKDTQTGVNVEGKTIKMTELLKVGAYVIKDDNEISKFLNQDGSVNRSSVINMITADAETGVAKIKMHDLVDYTEDANGIGRGVIVAPEQNTAEAPEAPVNGLVLPASEETSGTTEDKPIALILYMPAEIGNEANFRGAQEPRIAIGVSMIAGQAASESDSFDDKYDVAANYPAHFDIEAYLDSLNTNP